MEFVLEIIEQAKQEKPKKRNSQTQPSKENAKKLKLEEESEGSFNFVLLNCYTSLTFEYKFWE